MVIYRNNSSNYLPVLPTNYFRASSKVQCRLGFIEENSANPGIICYLPLFTALIIITVIAVISNGGFLIVAFRSRCLQTGHYVFLISLSTVDLFTGIVVTPITAASFIFLMYEKYNCILLNVWLISFHAVCMISLNTVAMISIEKYLAIMHTLYHQRVVTNRKLVIVALVVWIYGVTFSSVSHLIGLSYPEIMKSTTLYASFSGITTYVAIFYCYGKTYQEIRRVKRRIALENTFQNDHTAVREGSKAAKTTAIIIGALTLCYIPLITVYILSGQREKLKIPGKLEAFVIRFGTVVVLFNSTLNPLIYYIRMSLVRREFKRIFCQRRSSP